MAPKQLGISMIVYEEFEGFIGELTQIKKHHITASDGLHFLLEFYNQAKDVLKPPAGASTHELHH